MEALRETTEWAGNFPNHTYLLEGTNLLAYIRAGTEQVTWFSKPMKNFDRRSRTFVKVDKGIFGSAQVQSSLIQVQGSRGAVYYVDPEKQSCTCSGYTFRGRCRHLTEALGQ